VGIPSIFIFHPLLTRLPNPPFLPPSLPPSLPHLAQGPWYGWRYLGSSSHSHTSQWRHPH